MVKRKRSTGVKCLQCSEVISSNDKYVILKTKEHGKDLSADYFHFDCWKNYFNECVRKKLQTSQQKATELIEKSPIGKGILSSLKNYLGFDINNLQEEIKKVAPDIEYDWGLPTNKPEPKPKPRPKRTRKKPASKLNEKVKPNGRKKTTRR